MLFVDVITLGLFESLRRDKVDIICDTDLYAVSEWSIGHSICDLKVEIFRKVERYLTFPKMPLPRKTGANSQSKVE